MNSPREILIAWASSGGFAAVHNAGATDAQIVDDLLRWLAANGFEIVATPAFRVGDKITTAGERVADGNPFPRELVITKVLNG
jgi:hypothetical protein